MKYFTFKNGHKQIDEKQWLDVELYAESRLAARSILKRVLFDEDRPDDAPSEDPNLVITFISERDLEDGEQPDQIIRGAAPNGYTWERSY